MPRLLCALIAVTLLASGLALADDTFVRLTTDEGPILLKMRPDVAPNHVANFTHLCRTGFYDGTVFHRVIPGFMIQGGDPNSKDENRGDDGTGGPLWSDVLEPGDAAKVAEVSALLKSRGYAGFDDRAQLIAEFNSESHVRGTLSMARSQDPNSAGSQFFICVADTPHLDGKYTVFGKAVTGLEVIDAIVSAERDRRDYPNEPARITRAEVLEGMDALSDDEKAALAEPEPAAAAVE